MPRHGVVPQSRPDAPHVARGSTIKKPPRSRVGCQSSFDVRAPLRAGATIVRRALPRARCAVRSSFWALEGRVWKRVTAALRSVRGCVSTRTHETARRATKDAVIEARASRGRTQAPRTPTAEPIAATPAPTRACPMRAPPTRTAAPPARSPPTRRRRRGLAGRRRDGRNRAAAAPPASGDASSVGGSDAAGGESAGEGDGGCGCRVVPTRAARGSGALFAIAVGALALRRRRRDGTVSGESGSSRDSRESSGAREPRAGTCP
jgi:MYXO-CTERM domain-containing protein